MLISNTSFKADETISLLSVKYNVSYWKPLFFFTAICVYFSQIWVVLVESWCIHLHFIWIVTTAIGRAVSSIMDATTIGGRVLGDVIWHYCWPFLSWQMVSKVLGNNWSSLIINKAINTWWKKPRVCSWQNRLRWLVFWYHYRLFVSMWTL